MVTLPLERMASRVAASLCYATGLGREMVVNSQQVRCMSRAITWCCTSHVMQVKHHLAYMPAIQHAVMSWAETGGQ